MTGRGQTDKERPAGEAAEAVAMGSAADGTAASGAAGRAVAPAAIPPAAPLWFPDAPSKPARLLPPLALAYIGDAVFEVAVRQHVMSRANLRPHHLHRESTRYVSAKAQAQLLALLEPQLTEDERTIVRQGRNAKSGTIPKNADVLEYRHATAFESLVGYLYYTGAHDRLRQLVAQGFAHLDSGRRD